MDVRRDINICKVQLHLSDSADATKSHVIIECVVSHNSRKIVTSTSSDQ